MNRWVKSSFSNGTGGNNRVEVYISPFDGGVAIRNSKRPAAEWAAFVAGVKAGEFDGEQ